MSVAYIFYALNGVLLIFAIKELLSTSDYPKERVDKLEAKGKKIRLFLHDEETYKYANKIIAKIIVFTTILNGVIFTIIFINRLEGIRYNTIIATYNLSEIAVWLLLIPMVSSLIITTIMVNKKNKKNKKIAS